MVQPKLTATHKGTRLSTNAIRRCVGSLSDYPIRLDLSKFFKRYRILLSTAFSTAFPKTLDEASISDHRMLCSCLIELIVTYQGADGLLEGLSAQVLSFSAGIFSS
jgi:hypothetical protein